MGLNIRLLRGNKCVINGAVITCKSPRMTISVDNFAQVLRAPDILDQNDVKTPTQRAYFAVQLMLIEKAIDPANVKIHRYFFNTCMGRLLAAFTNPDIHVHLHEAINHVDQGDYYRALKSLKNVIAYEKTLLEADEGPGHSKIVQRELVEASA